MRQPCERTSERSRARKQSEQSGASERVSGASERANGRASGPVLTSVFFSIFNHSEGRKEGIKIWKQIREKKNVKRESVISLN